MAKKVELTQVQKGKSEFNLIGRAKVSDFTFKTDMQSNKSDWIYNQLNLGVDCGKYGVIYADMMGGYGSDRDNKVYVHGKKENDKGNKVDDFKSNFTIDWDDRFDEELFETIGDRCFLTIGIEKDIEGKTVYRKFLSEYDAIQYIKDNLQDGTVVNVKGNLKYQLYNGSYTVKKEITSIALSKAEEKDFKATFTQALLLDDTAIGKPDKETMTIPITAMVVDFFKEYDGVKIVRNVNGKNKEGYNIPVYKVFDIEIGEDKDKVNKVLKLFKVKKDKVNELTVDGFFTKGSLNTVEVSEDDIPDDIKELIELDLIDKDEVLGKIAFANGGKRPEKMVIKNPHINMIEVEGKGKMPQIAREIEKYTLDDVNPLLIIESLGIKQEENGDEEFDTDKLIDQALNDDEDDDWLAELDD